MKKIKKYLSLILCVAMVINFTLPNFATNENHFESSGTDYTTTSAFDANENDGIVEEEQTGAEEDANKNGSEDGNATEKDNDDTTTKQNNDNESENAKITNGNSETSNNIETSTEISDSSTNPESNKKTDSIEVAVTNEKPESNEIAESSEINKTAKQSEVTTETTNATEPNETTDTTEPSETTTTTDTTEATHFDDENISTPSDAATFEENEELVATESDIIIEKNNDYAKLTAVEQFNYIVDDSAKFEDGTITLLKDVELYDIVRFIDDTTLDLNGFSITGPENNYTLYVENNFTIIDSSVKQKENNANDNTNNDANDNTESNQDDNQDNNHANEIEITSSIKSTNHNFPVIYAKNAKLNIGTIQILAADGARGGDAIHLFNSDLTIDGAIIKAGNGADVNDDKGGDGGNAVVVYKATKQNIIKVNSGSVCGGNGGKGLGDETPDAGAAISYNGIYQGGVKTGKGRKGKKGGGNGGMAINILTRDFKMENVTFESMTLFAGSAGASIVKLEEEKNKNDFALFGTVDEDVAKHYYSLHDLDGKNYLTSLKNQQDFGLCAVYAMCAQIETYIMMEFPEFVRDVCHKVTDTVAKTFPSRDQEINVSEVYFGLAQNKTPTDAFGNAGSSDAGNTDGWTWGTSTQTQVALASTWRGLVFEDDNITDEINYYKYPSYPYRPTSVKNLSNRQPNQTFIDSYANKTAIHAKNMRIYEGLDYVDDDNNFDRDRLISDLKRAIVTNHGVYFGLFLESGYTNVNYISSTGVNYGTCTMFINYETMSGSSGHGMYIIGWDDDFEYTIPSNPKPGGGKDKGVFILKNSWDEFSLIPQDRLMYWASKKTSGGPDYVLSADFMAGEYMPAFTQYENNYFYDTGVSGVSMNSKVSINDKTLSANTKADIDVKYKKLLNVFKIRNDKEKAVAASFYGNLNNKQYEVALYRVPNDTNEAQIYAAINNESNKLTSKTFTNYHGVNVIDFDTPVDLIKGTYVAVVITSDEDNMGRTWIDGEGMEEVDISCTFHHTTDAKQKSFLAGPTVEFKNIYVNDAAVTGDEFNTIKNNYANDLTNAMGCHKITNANLRIKLWTNNYVTINTGDDGNIGGNTLTYYYPTLKASMSDIPIPTVTNADKKFVGYNTKADGTGKKYDENSIYSLDIADYLTLYAQYENKEQATEPSTEQTTEQTTAQTTEQTTEQTTAQSTEQTTAQTTEQTTAQSTEASTEPTKPSIAPTEASSEPSTEASTEKTTEASTERTTAQSTEASTEPTKASVAPTEATTKANKTNTQVNNGGGTRGGGGGGGIKVTNLPNIAPPEIDTQRAVSKVQSKSSDININIINSNVVTWQADATTNKWKLNVGAASGGNSIAPTGFYVISKTVNNSTVADTYYIDNSGNMMTGWLNTADDKWYYFDATKDGNEGKMAIGWKQVQNDWYYFLSNGTMMINGMTPDGYTVGSDGKCTQ